ncbi:VWA domain-containing protein [Neorhizobium galegae]|uniref:vWA domain-containing protein n=1 Tax=Neorhizobium galegae TaxID=399 RepID=UPI000621D28F|nr:VWA domain-containing protein [Neorhizobium galegae]MCQ1768899.1 VWA domain-containing protein [Neorhizobium galegae]MCQ1848706.1 VWA domain-containing protein [Neorhizobium galegae]CDZ39913.1 CoxE family protein [Neorhizobium galegae bv. officinalis]
MFIPFFLHLKEAKVPVTLREFLDLLEGMEEGIADFDVEAFYFLARTALVKDERHIDKFDRVFSSYFRGLEAVSGEPGLDVANIPEEWLRKLVEKHLTDEEKKLVESLGGFEKLMETLRKRLEEQKGRHQGGSKWIGTGGTSPFGAYGYNPEGVRIGQDQSRHRRAVKVWDKREFADFDDKVELGTRNIKLALKRLRRWVREGAVEELDLPGTIRSTAEHGYLDVQTRPERRNAVKLLMFFDVGGSMDDHIRVVEELFSAARAEFKHMEHFYFHNCLYEGVWKENGLRSERTPTLELIRSYGADYKVIFVGDASMSPYEITHTGGSVEHWNQEPGGAWIGRVTEHFHRCVWLNPVPQDRWSHTTSIGIMRQLMTDRMFPLTLGGLEQATRSLTR